MTRLARVAAWLAVRVLDVCDRRSATARAYNVLAEDRAAIERITGREFPQPVPVDEVWPETPSWPELAWEARFDEVAHEMPMDHIDARLADLDPQFAAWLRGGGS